jgi:hypothetical protein
MRVVNYIRRLVEMTRKQKKMINRAAKARTHNYKENRDVFLGSLRQAD